MEIKRARRLDLFDTQAEKKDEPIPEGLPAKVPVSVLMCGGMHSVVLTPAGQVYTWGCNDDGALGRTTGNDGVPGLVSLAQPVNGISVGNSHSIFYNTTQSNAFFCGLYRNAVSGRTGDPTKEPVLFGEGTFKKGKNTLVKIVSGYDHSMALMSDSKVFAWGDAESGKIGRMLKSRNRIQQSHKIEQVGARQAVDIFCTGHSSFYKNKKG